MGRFLIPLAAASLALACARAPQGRPDPRCPEGSRLFGDEPPEGKAWWCRKLTADGKWVGHGPFRSWYFNDTLQAEGNVVNGVRQGAFKMYFINGQLMSEAELVNGRSQGVVRTWHMNGQLATTAWFEGGEESGPYQSFWEEGTMAAEGQYRKGWEEGRWTFWAPSGLLHERGVFLRGKREGWWERWKVDGTPTFQILYEAGDEIAPGPLSSPQVAQPPPTPPAGAAVVR